MRGLPGPFMVVAARVRRSRSWILPTLALALVFGFAGAVASESLIVGDQAARAALRGLAPIDRTVRLVWEGPLTPYGVSTAERVFARLGVRHPTQVLLLNPVRLSDAIVHPVGISPIRRWLPSGAVRSLGPCRPSDCPVLVAGRGRVPATLATAGVRMRVVGRVDLSSVPLGYSPGALGDWPILVTGDVAGLGAIEGLSGVYRTYSWVGLVPVEHLHSWSLSAFKSRLAAAQAGVSPLSTRFTLEAPFFGLEAAQGRASVAVHRLLLVDGGVAVILVLFILLAANALQRDQAAEIERLKQAGGRRAHTAMFVLAEGAWISALAVLAGLGLAVGFTAILASGAGEPLGGLLDHGLLSPTAAAALLGGWALTTALLALAPLVRGGRVIDFAALVAVAVLVTGLLLGVQSTRTWIGLLVPLVSLSAGLVLFRASGAILRAGEQLARRGSLTVRLALVSLARARGTAGLAIAFLAISTALAGFGLSFRATLIRGAADQAADRVPLDALVSAGSSFATPLQIAPLARWRALSHGLVFPVRRTQANYAAGGGTATVPALGIPAGALPLLHGWRDSDGAAPLAVLARRLRPPGPARNPGPVLPQATRWVQLGVRSPNLDLVVTLDLRDPAGAVHRLALGTTGLRPRVLRARVPPGRWEVEAVELSELTGTAITNGHQNGENPAPATQFSARLTLGPLLGRDATGHPLLRQALGGWRAVGAASEAPGARTGAGPGPTPAVAFQTTGWPGVVRPPQPSDTRALPILVDRTTAAAAGPQGRIGLTVGGVPVQARVVGVLRRFPTVGAGASGFVVADQALLSGALDAQLPGQGLPDELWVSAPSTGALRAALRHGPLAQLSAAYRTEVEHGLRSDPVASGVTHTLLASGAVATLLALLGMLLVLAGPLRTLRIQADLEAQGVGPSGLRRELRVRFGVACTLGIWSGLLIALLLDRLTVAAVGAYESGTGEPPLITVVPVLELVVLGVGLTALCLVCGWLLSEALLPRRRRIRRPSRAAERPLDDAAQELVR
jgi:hypothetical protein